jgi:HSP20 family molecular chaperone IbpA
MTTEITSKSQGAKHPRVFKLRDASPFSQLVHQAYKGVARRAYELYESRGRQDGHDLEDWCRAESELLHSLPVEISETNDQVIVHARVPGLSDEDIEVRIAPHRLVITGKWRTIRDGRNTQVEKSSEGALHEVDLSQTINPDEVTAMVQGGKLEIHMKKARPAKNNPKAMAAA